MTDFTARDRPVTLTDVARTAGVSAGTASKALNGRFDVNDETRRRVLEIAERLQFQPNALARGLLAGKSYSVGIVTSDMAGRFAPHIMFGAESALGAANSSVLMCNTGGDPEREERHIRTLLGRRVDGLIIVDDLVRPRPPITIRSGTPVVYAFAPSVDSADTSIIPDETQGARLATEHLLSLGRRAILHVGGPLDAPSAVKRAAGTRDALSQAGLPASDSEILFGPWLEQWGWDAVEAVLERGAPIDGVVCGNDQIARGVLDCLEFRGVSVPGTVAVVGFDNWMVLTQAGRMPTSSIDMRLQDLGAAAVEALFGKGEPSGGVRELPCELIVRRSSALADQT